MKSDVVRLFQTLPHDCGYYVDRTAQNLVIDPSAPNLSAIYGLALARGFRRAGGHVYHPHCVGCQACVPCRLAVGEFQPTRSQRRCLKRNADLSTRIAPARFTDEYFDLYSRYLAGRHRDGGMDHPSPDDFGRFLYTDWSPTRFLEIRRDNDLLGVAVTDICAEGLSAVYTFYDPAESSRGLGTFGILAQIEWARLARLPHLYLGYWINRHPKMDYKRLFQPMEVMRHGQWRPFAEHDAPNRPE
ncbi:arginyltransferase [Tahibacter amnicola]|uniref:Aspartate/glutamate leucyltransferase n=1 Tax=Tahibacter amnicola TaxID=2976241 RepID=A0ABY6BKA9_9GAMM|nr:arginyltransferase [Tahibacter amnicola]UXI69907.1 arginyltransferase [Tahibacter amnicola]